MLGKSRAETGGGMAERSKDRGLGAFVRRHGLVSFYAMAYGMSWLFWLPYVLSQNGLGVLDVSFPEILGDTQLAGILLGAYLGPLGAAFVVTALSEGRPGLRLWGGRLFRWDVGWRWYVLALVGVPALLVAGALVVSPGAAAGLRSPPWLRCSPTCRSSCCRCSPPVWRRSPGGVTSPWCATSASRGPSWAP
jgi:hypothetical protein